MPENNLQKKETILFIAGGGLKIAGVAIGVLKVLEKYFKENNIKIDRVIGVSGGAIVAGLYALGYNSAQMNKIILHYWTRDLFRNFNINPFKGIIKGDRIEKVFYDGYNCRKFSDTKISLSIIVSELKFIEAKPVVIEEGYLHEAVRVSVSIPLFLEPKNIGGKSYYDGGVAVIDFEDVAHLFNSKEVYSIEISQKRFTKFEWIIKIFHYFLKRRFFVKKDQPRQIPNNVKIHKIITPIFDKIQLWESEHLPLLILEGERVANIFIKDNLKNHEN